MLGTILVYGLESEDYWVVFGWTLDDYISADGGSYDTGVIYSVSSRYGPYGDEEPPEHISFLNMSIFIILMKHNHSLRMENCRFTSK